MSEELEVLEEVARRLDRAKIAYMITGATGVTLRVGQKQLSVESLYREADQ